MGASGLLSKLDEPPGPISEHAPEKKRTSPSREILFIVQFEAGRSGFSPLRLYVLSNDLAEVRSRELSFQHTLPPANLLDTPVISSYNPCNFPSGTYWVGQEPPTR